MCESTINNNSTHQSETISTSQQYAFQGGQRHHGRFGTPEEEKGGEGAGGSKCRRVSPGDAALGYAYADDAGVVSQSPDRAAEEDDGGDRGRMRGV